MSHHDRTSLRTRLLEVCGNNAALPSNNDDVEVKSFLTIMFSALVDPNLVIKQDRLNVLTTSIEEGKTALMDSNSIERAAAGGFVTDEDRDYVACPACKTRVKVDQVPVAELLKFHSSACPYPLLCSQFVSRDLLQQPYFKPLVEHLHQEWLSTKVTVALDLGFHPCLLLIALAHHYLQHGAAFPTAGDLVESLLDMEDPDVQKPPALWDVTLFIRDAEFLRKYPSSPASASAVSGTFQEHFASHERPRDSMNRLSNTPDTRLPPSSEVRKKMKEKLVEDTMRLYHERKCKSCGKIDADRLLTNCGHLSLCFGCLQLKSSCPICDVPITGSIQVYLS